MKTYGDLRFEEGGYGYSSHWFLRCGPDVAIRLKRIFPRAFQLATGYIRLDATDEIARELEWVTDRWPLRTSHGDRRRLKRQAREYSKRLELVVTGHTSTSPSPRAPPATTSSSPRTLRSRPGSCCSATTSGSARR